MKPLWIVTWTGGLLAGELPQAREFPTRTRAKQWARMAGVGKAAKLHRIVCYDNGGRSADRYTVVYLDMPEDDLRRHYRRRLYTCLGMNRLPFHPHQGIGMHGSAMVGRHLGQRIPFAALPDDCRKAVLQDLAS